MKARGRNVNFSRVVAIAGLSAGLITVASLLLLRAVYQDCVEMACMGIFFFVPVGAAGSGIAALVIGARAHLGLRGYGAALIGVTIGFLGVLVLIREFPMLLH